MDFQICPPIINRLNEEVYALDQNEFGIIVKILRLPFIRFRGHRKALIRPLYQIKNNHGCMWIYNPEKSDYKSIDEIEFVDMTVAAHLSGVYSRIYCPNGSVITIQDPEMLELFPDGEVLHRIHVFPSELDYFNWNNASVISLLEPRYIFTERNHRMLSSTELNTFVECLSPEWSRMLSEYNHIDVNSPIPDYKQLKTI